MALYALAAPKRERMQMNIHEYQAKNLLKSYGVVVPSGGVAFSINEANKIAKNLGGPVWVVKSQIHAGGRGAGHFKDDAGGKGGVRVVESLEKVEEAASEMLGKVLVTRQTGPVGKEVKRIYVEEGCEIQREHYLSMLVDRQSGRITIIASTEGGMDIEEIASKSPEKIIMVAIDPVIGMTPFYARKVAFGLGLGGSAIREVINLLSGIYKLFNELDASLIEINPLVVTRDGKVLALDAKMNFDDNALFRQKEILELRDENEEDPTEAEAASHDLNYITLDGNIGCMVNGAGLAMSTMDIIKLHGGEPANFLDVGGSADRERVTKAFKLILSDPSVEGILVNIFGGIMRCDVVAEGIVAAVRDMALKIPLVVRLEGTNVDLGKEILEQSGLSITPAEDLSDAAKKIVQNVASVS